jgi:tetratricopeptide (TPR) repeat protein
MQHPLSENPHTEKELEMQPKLFTVMATVILLAAVFFGQTGVRNPKREQAISKQLTLQAPSAVDTFQRATAAMDKGDYQQSAQLYREVLKQAPDFTPAMRRLGFSLAGMGQVDDAIALLESAVKIERSPENLASLATILASPGERKEGTPQQRETAYALAKEAVARNMDSSDSSYLVLTAQLALNLRREADFRSATALLVRKFPDEISTHYFSAIRSAMDENWIGAEDEIKKAERLGLPVQAAQAFLDSGVHTRATAWRWSYYVLYLLSAWACGLLFLFVAGKVFSKLTLRFIETAGINSTISRGESILRRYYRGLINAAGTYYYISIPFVIFLVLAVTVSIVYAFLVLGHVPVKLVGILVIGAILTIYKMIHSLFVRVGSEEPGRPLNAEEAPGLWILTREVAENLCTRPLDAIRIVPGTEMAVYERGGYRDRRRGLGKRTLIMGVGLIPGFDQNAFRAVLTHEYGHLAHRDTAGGDVALRVNQDMMKFAIAMVQAGQAVWWNIGFQFLRLYHFLFRRISHGATRLQEILADRAAARLYGPLHFEEGLRHVVRRQFEFKDIAEREIGEALRTGRALQNIYALEMPLGRSVATTVDQEINRPTSEDDTHPSPADRFRLVSRVVCETRPGPSGPLWALFVAPDAITREMSLRVANMAGCPVPIANLGVIDSRRPASDSAGVTLGVN